MCKTSVYLSDDLKAALSVAAARSGRSEADTIRLALEAFVPSAGPDPRARRRTLAAAAERIAVLLQQGELVTFATLGDPHLYSSFPALAEAVQARQSGAVIEAEPGFLLFPQLAAATSTTVAQGEERITVAILGDDPAELDSLFDHNDSTVVIYKGGPELPAMATSLARRGRLGAAMAGELLGQPGERCLALAELATGPGSDLAIVIVPARRSPAVRGCDA